MRSTLVSALLYWTFSFSIESPARWNRPANPFFFSSGSMELSWATSSESISPTWPMSLVRTVSSAPWEKSAMFFWAAAP